MPEAEEQEAVLKNSNQVTTEEAIDEDSDEFYSKKSTADAIAAYRKIREGKTELTEKEQIILDKECKIIEEREIIEAVATHEPIEIGLGKEKIQIGPPTLTRFEKARIMGARALQLSLGAPPFIEIPKTARSSLDIALEELNRRVIPIIIRRVLPNGDYQNIPIDHFA